MDDKSKVGIYTLGAFAVGFAACTIKESLSGGQMVVGLVIAIVGTILMMFSRGFMEKL